MGILKSNYYRDLANSMCDQLLRAKNLSPASREHILCLKLINHRLRDLADPALAVNAELLESLNTTAMQLVVANTVRFRDLLSSILRENDSCEVIMRTLSPAQCQE